jgi:formylglycine-generating enzyme required for sulfatase activity
MADGDCNKRILRGGSYNSYSRALRSASRHADRTDIWLKVHGFRIARTLSARGSTITVSPTEH